MKTFSNIDDLIEEALGGTNKAAAIFGEHQSTVSNWKARGKLPTNKFLAHQEILKALCIEAPASLWFDLPKKEAAA